MMQEKERIPLNFSLFKSVPIIYQTQMSECGLASLAMIASYYGHTIDLVSIGKRFNAAQRGMNLQQMMDVANQLNLACRPLQCPLNEIYKLSLPCILHWDMNHFVVLTKIIGDGPNSKIIIHDPAKGQCRLSRQEFSEHFTGICLELTPTSSFKRQKRRSSFKFYQLWSHITGIKSGLLKLILLSIVLQGLALLSPYYMQWVIDEVVVSYDRSLLLVLAIGFGFIVIVSSVTKALRSWLTLRLSSQLNMQMGINVVNHLLRLPMQYFESRHVGDVVSRFGSLAQIRERIANGLVETFMDGVMSIAVLVVLFLYSVKLTCVVIVAMMVYLLLRLAIFTPFKQATATAIESSAKEQSNFLESIRGIQTIKLFANESQRQSLWQNRYSEVINAHIRVGRLSISFEFIKGLIFGIENIVLIYFAAMAVIANQLTLGMVLAFVAYKGQIIERFSNVIEQIIQFKMMRLHLERISDITLTPVEENLHGIATNEQCLGKLELDNVCFQFQQGLPPLLNGINLTVESNDCIAITGLSGSGKTTLMKIMLGLLKPTSGRVLLDGKDIMQIGLQNYRKTIASVMQDDTLLAGSIADNISFFDPQPDLEKVAKCAKHAAIDADIRQMVMGYNTLVGDMGASLSGGQIQRILLARALYKSPTMLFMDEATSHLDKANEMYISKQIQLLSMTRIIIAHRQETIAQVDKVYTLVDGKLSEQCTDAKIAV
ncbi:peptidase domain-containing ABC transporter [Thalassotalea crassostreae]|uniref:peptidase domain-containing ABC transporter n=1 Tax=Thalassotalea crassostreae TaxID=1763536 RepID=UPI000A724846|nr:peptidase domain-containing ABC transporter [Thalassotalea crassostreae]